MTINKEFEDAIMMMESEHVPGKPIKPYKSKCPIKGKYCQHPKHNTCTKCQIWLQYYDYEVIPVHPS